MMKQHRLFNQMLQLPTRRALKLIGVFLTCLFAFQGTAAASGTSAPETEIPGFVFLGEYGGNLYYCSQNNYNWNNAQALVAQHGGHMVSINSWEENSYVSSRLMADVAWLGYSSYNNNSWNWTSGEPTSIANWDSNEPDGSGYGAVILRNSGYWRDRHHTDAYEVVMEIPGCGPKLNICNNGTCPVNLYHWLPNGDVSLGTLQMKVTPFMAVMTKSGMLHHVAKHPIVRFKEQLAIPI